MSERPLIDAAFFGRIPYDEALRLQHQVHAMVVAGESSGACLALEHPAVLTFGKNADPHNLLTAEAVLRQRGVTITTTERGGEVTAHMPGQLVLYPILPLARLGIGARSYVCALEEAVIRALADWGVTATRDPEHPGVWVGDQKICALGVRIKERVSLHGLALNLTNELDLFNAIIPCGIRNRGVTSYQALTGRALSLTESATRILMHLGNILRFTPHWRDGQAILANRGGTPYDIGPISIPKV